MRQYLDLLQQVLDHGADRSDRTGTGTRGVFGYQMRFDLSKGFPVTTTKKLHLRSIIYDYPGKVLWSRIRVRPDGTVTGYRETRGWAPGRQLYFAMRFSSKPGCVEIYNREQPKPEYDPGFAPWAKRDDVIFREGRGLVAVFDFGTLPASHGVIAAE